MSQPMSRGKIKRNSSASGWDRAITDAQELLDRVEQKATRLRSAIRTFKESKAAGEPYAGESVQQVATQN